MKTHLVSISATLAATSVLLVSGCATLRGTPPLQAAVVEGDAIAIRQILLEGTPNGSASGGWTALHRAAYGGNRQIAQVLLDAGANMNAKDKQGFTPLHWAVYESLLLPEAHEVAKLLVIRGADINARDKEGCTPLFWALWQGNRGLADFLVAHGADPTIRGKENLTPLELARRYR